LDCSLEQLEATPVSRWIIGAVTDGSKGMTSFFFSIWAWIASILESVVVVWLVSLIGGRDRANS
jgi:hypothetical protein